MPDENNLIWIDLEMSGLDASCDVILEIASIVTNSELEILAQGPVLAVFQEDELLNLMDDWNQSHHQNSGLLDAVRQSQITVQIAEQETLRFLSKWLPAGISPLCGNSIGHDRQFIARLMPELHGFFHYRNIDVSTLKELRRRWWPNSKNFVKANEHRALVDIKESIAELRFYLKTMFQDMNIS